MLYTLRLFIADNKNRANEHVCISDERQKDYPAKDGRTVDIPDVVDANIRNSR